jgi:hypothetical protein
LPRNASVPGSIWNHTEWKCRHLFDRRTLSDGVSKCLPASCKQQAASRDTQHAASCSCKLPAPAASPTLQAASSHAESCKQQACKMQAASCGLPRRLLQCCRQSSQRPPRRWKLAALVNQHVSRSDSLRIIHRIARLVIGGAIIGVAYIRPILGGDLWMIGIKGLRGLPPLSPSSSNRRWRPAQMTCQCSQVSPSV